MPVNGKQTSPRIAEMARQDPTAPVRHAPGSGLTAPGRTGFVGTNWGPTTTRAEVMAFMQGQKGNVVLSPWGIGYVFTEGWDAFGEVWRLDGNGRIADIGLLEIAAPIPGLPPLLWPSCRLPHRAACGAAGAPACVGITRARCAD